MFQSCLNGAMNKKNVTPVYLGLFPGPLDLESGALPPDHHTSYLSVRWFDLYVNNII